jgi:hypothetical protein
MDRVIDAPVHQDILTWERWPDPVSDFGHSRSFQSSSLHLLGELAKREGCGLLADGQTRQSNNHSGIRRDCCVPFRRCRLLVVLIKGHDLCPSEDREKCA